MSTRAGEFPPASEAGRYYFKAVARVGPRLVSIFDGKTEYIFGSTLAHRDIPNAKLYVWSTPFYTKEKSPSILLKDPILSLLLFYNVTTIYQCFSSVESLYIASILLYPFILTLSSPPGYYVCNSPEEAVTAAIPKTAALYVAPRIIIKCLAWGQITYHPVPGSQPPKNMIGKNTLVFTRIRPLEVIPIPLGAKNTKFSQRELTGIKLQYAREISPPFSATAGRNARPFQRSETDQRALRQNIVVMVGCLAVRIAFAPLLPLFLSHLQIIDIHKQSFLHSLSRCPILALFLRPPFYLIVYRKNIFVN